MVSYKQKHIDIALIGLTMVGESVLVRGCVRDIKVQAECTFVKLFDGSTSVALQLVVDNEFCGGLKGVTNGASLSVYGVVKKHYKKEEVEVHVSNVEYAGTIHDPKKCILSASRPSLEALRACPTEWGKSPVIHACRRISSGLLHCLGLEFHKLGFAKMDPSVLTISDCEGAGEMFMLDKGQTGKFFGQEKVGLTVSSQWGLELFVQSEEKVWTDNPSFRAEPSDSSRHLASFKHIEWELGWADLDDLMDLSEQLTQACFNYVLSAHMDDLLVLDGSVSKGIIERLRTFVSDSYARLSYNDAIDMLVAAFNAGKLDSLVKWGDDLGSLYESYLAESVFGKPIFVYNYPKGLKSFYMKQNDDGLTVQGCDLLMPGLGELIGSSVRESDYDKLIGVVLERGMNTEGIEWYLDLRRNGSKPSAGAGLGFERLVMCCTGLKNIRLCGTQPVYYKGKLVF